MNEYRALIRRSEFINVTIDAPSEEEARDIIAAGLWSYSEFSDYGDDLEIITLEVEGEDEDAADGYWVVDAIELRAWGPFDSLAAAEAFQEQDKYLSGSCIIREGAPDRWCLYPPEVY